MEYYEQAGLVEPLEALGFHLVGYGCTTCIGNSGPLPEEISEVVNAEDLAVVSVLSRQPQLRGPHQPRREDELPRVAAARGRVRAGRDDGHRPARRAARPGLRRRGRVPQGHLALRRGGRAGRRGGGALGDVRSSYGEVFEGDENWNAPRGARGRPLRLGRDSTYVRRPPFFEDVPAEPEPRGDIEGARVLAHARRLGDDRPHLPGRRDQEGLAGGAVPQGARRRARGTSTPTGRAAATTR